MYRQHRCRCHACAPHGGYYPGLAEIARGLFFLTVSAVRGGVRLVQTAANGAVWGPCGCEVDCCSGPCRPALHGYCVECLPPVYAGCCRPYGE
jgi:hypothetical protein